MTPEQMNATMQEHKAKMQALITDATQFATFEKCMEDMRPKLKKDRGPPPEVRPAPTTAASR